MAKKQFIRHLEFYGFPDQNGYSSDINGVDLSDIREKNKEQDKEIQELEGEKAEQKDLLELSGTVESFIERQSEINQGFADAISGMSSDIDELKKVDGEFAEQLSAITDGVDDAMETIEILGERVDDLEDGLSGLSGAVDSMMETIEDEFAKKDDVYTKEEIDAKIPSGGTFATEEWVESQGFLTFDSGDTRYALIEDVESLSGAVESATTGIEDEIDDIIDSINSISAETEEIEDEIDSLSGEVASAITDIKEDIDEISDKINENTEVINELKDEVSGITDTINEIESAITENTESIELLQQQVNTNTSDISNIYSILDTKANVSDLEELHNEMTCKVEELEDKKADKTDLVYVSGAVDDLSDELRREIERSIGVDEELSGKVENLESQVETVSATVATFNGKITDVENGLAQEILDRQQGDINLIGTEDDNKNADTIWGAKNFAKEMKRQAVSEAEVYTNDAVSSINTQLEELEEEFDQKLSGYATEEWVNGRITDTKIEINGKIDQEIEDRITDVNAEETRALNAESDLRENINNALDEISHNATRINAITEWNGSDPSEYVDTGNGILDVLHKEFHEYERSHGAIESIEFLNGNLIITYQTSEGTKQEVFPISEIVVLDDYYRKSETSGATEIQSALNEKLDASAYTPTDLSNYYTKSDVDNKLGTGFTENSITDVIESNEFVTSKAINELNRRITRLEEIINRINN